MSAGHDPLEAFRAAFRAAAQIAPAAVPEEGTDEGAPRADGCLLVNTAIELAPHDIEVAALVAASLAEVEGFFRNRLKAAVAAGQRPAEADAGSTAAALLALFLGLRVLARSGADVATRVAVVTSAGAMLR